MRNKERCDMCGTPIKEGKCSCGTWKSKEEMENCPLKKGIEAFHEMRQLTLTGDAPHLGCAVVYFRGDYKDSKAVEQFIYELKGRAFYEGDNDHEK